ncbi:MAG: hypothetical protein WA154_07215 [Moraxellaceae bacterium]
MSAVIEKISGWLDSHEEEGERCGENACVEGTWASTEVVIDFKMNAKQSRVYYAHDYVMTEDGPAESTPDEFKNRIYTGTWQEKLLNLSDDLDNEDSAAIQAVIEASKGILTSVDDIKALRVFIDEERPRLSNMHDFI